MTTHVRRPNIGWIEMIWGIQRFLDIFLNTGLQISANVLSFVTDEHPEHIERNIDAILNRLYDKNTHVAVKRNVVRILQSVQIPKRLDAKVINFSMEYLSDLNETVAVRCFSMNVLVNMSEKYPEIKKELKAVIENRLKDPTGGLKVRARAVLKELEKVR
jgi:hypothetical protein